MDTANSRWKTEIEYIRDGFKPIGAFLVLAVMWIVGIALACVVLYFVAKFLLGVVAFFFGYSPI